MPEESTIQRLRGLVLSATELKAMTQWPDALVEDYLTILDNIITLANLIDIEIDQKIEEIATDFTDGSIPFTDDGHLAEDNDKLFWDVANSILKITGIIQSKGRIKGTVYITPAMSPYSIQFEDEIIFCDTATAIIVLLLPEGTDGEPHKITNVGAVRNNVRLTPFGMEELEGDNATLKIHDTETLDIAYDENTGWWA